jgi:uncharacterized protein with PIN domain
VFLYAESSAVLAWLSGEGHGPMVGAQLARAEKVLSSTLTGLECARKLTATTAIGAQTREGMEARHTALRERLASWTIIAVSDDVAERAVRAFPLEPLRSLDAIHLATALMAHQEIGPVAMLSLDKRVRANAKALGLTVLPAEA